MGFILYVLLRQYVFTGIATVGDIEEELQKVQAELPSSDPNGVFTFNKLEYDEQYNLNFFITLSKDWSVVKENSTKESLLKELHKTDGIKGFSIFCKQNLVQLVFEQGGTLKVFYSLPDFDIKDEVVNIEC